MVIGKQLFKFSSSKPTHPSGADISSPGLFYPNTSLISSLISFPVLVNKIGHQLLESLHHLNLPLSSTGHRPGFNHLGFL